MKKGIILCLALFFSYTLSGQQEIKMSLDKYNKEKSAILNTIINSIQFDSINTVYNIKEPIFLKNEILANDSCFVLTYKKQRVKIVDYSLINDNDYWDLGDFFLNIYVEDPKDARVQIVLVLKNKEDIIIGVTLQKTKKWRIKNFVFVE
jgi:hypothetical protein